MRYGHGALEIENFEVVGVTVINRSKSLFQIYINFSRYLQNRRAKTPYSTSTSEPEYFEC